MNAILQKITDLGVMPVIKIEPLECAVPLATALRKGGLNALEVTVRNDVALEAIRAIKAKYPDMLVGAGTITSAEKAQQALNARADFIVAPGFNHETVRFCQAHNTLIVPGCVTPAELEQALAFGLEVVKFFPAENYGGLKTIEMLRGPFASIRFMPTGGIDFSNAQTYLRSSAIAAIGGSFMAKADLIKARDWDTITRNCQRAVACVLGFELAHVGLNCESEQEAFDQANAVDELFGLGVKPNDLSVFFEHSVECMKAPYYGAKGHIGFWCNNVERALAYFRARGVALHEDSIRADANGKLISFYFEEEIGGFAVHVCRRP